MSTKTAKHPAGHYRVNKGFSLLFPHDIPKSDGVWAMSEQVIDLAHPFHRACIDASSQWHKLRLVKPADVPGAEARMDVKLSQGRYSVLCVQPTVSGTMVTALAKYEGSHPQSVEEAVAAGGPNAVDAGALPGLVDSKPPKAKRGGGRKPESKTKREAKG